jgi:predicted glutamine amidotransferase
MCRLFGMTTGGPRVSAAYWLLDAPYSLRTQSHRMPHGAGMGWFSRGGEPVRDRAPLAAFENTDFEVFARAVVADTFVAHVRDASVGGLHTYNCHPFQMADRLFAHNGVVRGLDVLRSWLTEPDTAQIRGQTDSELACAYLTAAIEQHGDTTAGLVAAIRRMGAELPLYSVNLVLAEAGRLWALRYPETNELWALAPSDTGAGAYVVASEPLDDRPGWRLLEPGELLVVEGLEATSLFPFAPPAHPLRREDLSLREAASQHTIRTARRTGVAEPG